MFLTGLSEIFLTFSKVFLPSKMFPLTSKMFFLTFSNIFLPGKMFSLVSKMFFLPFSNIFLPSKMFPLVGKMFFLPGKMTDQAGSPVKTVGMTLAKSPPKNHPQS